MPSCLGQNVVYFLPHVNAQRLTDVQASVHVQKRSVLISVVRMHYEIGMEGEEEDEDDRRRKLKYYKINGELYNSLFSRYYGYQMEGIETGWSSSHTRKMRNGTAYSIAFGPPEGTSS